MFTMRMFHTPQHPLPSSASNKIHTRLVSMWYVHTHIYFIWSSRGLKDCLRRRRLRLLSPPEMQMNTFLCPTLYPTRPILILCSAVCICTSSTVQRFRTPAWSVFGLRICCWSSSSVLVLFSCLAKVGVPGCASQHYISRNKCSPIVHEARSARLR